MAYKPFETQADPANPGPFRVPKFALRDGVTMEQVDDRRGLFRLFDSIRRDIDCAGQPSALPRHLPPGRDALKALYQHLGVNTTVT